MSDRLDELRAQARFHRERRDLYRARTYGPRETSPTRLRELERAATLAEERLRFAEREAAAQQTGGDTPPAG
jgi:hypothetical protein